MYFTNCILLITFSCLLSQLCFYHNFIQLNYLLTNSTCIAKYENYFNSPTPPQLTVLYYGMIQQCGFFFLVHIHAAIIKAGPHANASKNFNLNAWNLRNKIKNCFLFVLQLTSMAIAGDALNFMAISGPTYNPLPPFQWSTAVNGSSMSHLGQPDLFQFGPVWFNGTHQALKYSLIRCVD